MPTIIVRVPRQITVRHTPAGWVARCDGARGTGATRDAAARALERNLERRFVRRLHLGP